MLPRSSERSASEIFRQRGAKVGLEEDMQALIDPFRGLFAWTLRTAGDIGDAISATVVLFVFGVVLMALAEARMERLEGEFAARPARAFALGLVGFIAAAVLGIALSVTIIGIPLAVVGAMAVAVMAYAGVIALLRTVGAGLIGHRTNNRYVQLALGCFLFCIVGAVPWLGPYAVFAVLCAGLGAVLGSRAAGLWRGDRSGYARV